MTIEELTDPGIYLRCCGGGSEGEVNAMAISQCLCSQDVLKTAARFAGGTIWPAARGGPRAKVDEYDLALHKVNYQGIRNRGHMSKVQAV